jgi:hypothetical protein
VVEREAYKEEKRQKYAAMTPAGKRTLILKQRQRSVKNRATNVKQREAYREKAKQKFAEKRATLVEHEANKEKTQRIYQEVNTAKKNSKKFWRPWDATTTTKTQLLLSMHNRDPLPISRGVGKMMHITPQQQNLHRNPGLKLIQKPSTGRSQQQILPQNGLAVIQPLNLIGQQLLMPDKTAR